MRLINTTTGEMRDFTGDVNVPYAILSHRWGSTQDEVSYQDYEQYLRTGTLKCDKPGYEKIRKFCETASIEEFQWAWIDTCCIDKRSSAEISEGINSMFSWYAEAAVCYVYLEDFDSCRQWHESVWWQRGWTLQELIAPKHVDFYDSKWQKFGSRAQIAKEIEKMFGIPYAVLTERRAYMKCCVAQRMSCAACRKTSLVEDRAYSLLGLFHINMPALYGEKSKAFERLQLALLLKYADESVLAWPSDASGPRRVLARSPDDFKECKDMVPSDLQSWDDGEELDPDPRSVGPARVTSWGIELWANARKLFPRRRLTVNGQVQQFVWSIALTIAWGGRIQGLPCTLILVRTGPAPYCYSRLELYRDNSAELFRSLKRDYRIHEVEENKLFYLQFDNDFEI